MEEFITISLLKLFQNINFFSGELALRTTILLEDDYFPFEDEVEKVSSALLSDNDLAGFDSLEFEEVANLVLLEGKG